ncbi:hypothetical protein BKP56_06955 [Marinilactibacillus sp. 15R]|uniref:DUF3102 domain-containing protein n=1 Tax=Marinilactibacillus sp. 15R TaxID=1911586 RepID=UPI00090BA4DC|nr:DUF3102 domain-containing protein [Marinilactibacillus sp. 15R]API89008.1 hypothetical protein BKP56_06955 [Marinilactibacillus sp. 15R]
MNELSLSSDLKQIELEINHHKQIAGQSIWEIGRRLNHVKENDLVHGEFMKWIESIGIEHTFAKRSMRVAAEFSNSAALPNLGNTALYLISTIPEEEREKEHITSKGESKAPDEMTVRELQELKKELKQKETQISLKEKRIQTLKQQNEDLEFKASQPPKVIEKEVVKEVKPHDYDGLKSDNEQLSQALKEAQSDNQKIKEQLDQWIKERKEVDEKSNKYDELSKAITNAENKLNGKQKLISNYHNLNELLRNSNEFLSKASSILYQDISEVTKQDGLAKRELGFLIERTERFLNDLKRQIEDQTIIEGEIINE